MDNGITYTRVGDYLLPNIRLKNEPDMKPIVYYGRMRRGFLKEHQPILYNQLLLTEKLFPHLREVDELVVERRKNGVSEGIVVKEIICDY